MEYKVEKNIYFKIAIFTFMVYMFFTFFGTKIPFQPKLDESKLGGTGNIVNQIVYSSLFLLSVISLFFRRLDALAIIKKEKLLTIFLIWCFISILWSYSPIDTGKRFFRTLTLFTVTLSLLVHTSSTKDILNFLKPILYPYIFISVIACLTISGAIDVKFNTWRGFEDTKNVLGGVSVVCILLTFFIYKMETGSAKFIAAIAMLFSFALLLGSRSATAISSFFIIAACGSIISIDELFKPLGLGRAVSAVILLFAFTMIAIFVLASPEIIAMVTEAIGKDPSFSGRTDLWTAMFISISHHPFLGTGYQAFWSVDPPSNYLQHIYATFVWIPNEAHNGFIDIANEVGLIGLVLFLIMIFRYFISMRRLNTHNLWKWLIIAALIGNMQESYLIEFGGPPGVMVVISYLILFTQLWKQDAEVE